MNNKILESFTENQLRDAKFSCDITLRTIAISHVSLNLAIQSQVSIRNCNVSSNPGFIYPHRLMYRTLKKKNRNNSRKVMSSFIGFWCSNIV